MRARVLHTRRFDALALTLLATFILRSYIPVGFMPANGTPFLLELCPAYAGIPMHHGHEHHQHSQTHADFQDCPFGSVPAPGPVSQLLAFAAPGRISSFVDAPREPWRLGVRPLRTHQPRGPPSPA